MSDRLAEIKANHEAHGLDDIDVDWLVAEVERYRGIPGVDKLLSGEMVAVPRDPDWSQGLLAAIDAKTDEIERKLAQTDARLNADVVKPSDG